ncbi:hypothetical protein LTR78_007112 [Recurvomyces mirabilis]|uniref:Uncharacterized protein n=1 Tax=Recurvomyces mirabilis TaxID=574656 RepID=A0AAE0WJS7_9PEZI|nr:hypothetical protein LTR78_007112 [Recurvomyces mirabilis]KAK5150916.1 hypothetical protein LTS14_009719 [Recurvomyces mirabilis]
MSSEQTFSTSDLRSTAQDYKRDAARKHKWQLGSNTTTGRAAGGKPRPHRPSETDYNAKRRESKGAVAALQNGAKVARKQDVLDGTAISDDSSNSTSDYDDTPSPAVDPAVMYSFDAARGPSQGSQILNTALANAVAKFEDRETVKLVKNEYEILDDEGESIGLTPVKKSKKVKAPAMIVPDADEDYELV